MATQFTYNVNFEITCRECGNDLTVFASDYREPELEIEPCATCLQNARNEKEEEMAHEIDEAFEAGERFANKS